MDPRATPEPETLAALGMIADGRIAEGERRLEHLANAGSAHALLQWARLHLYGLAPEPDAERARTHLDEAASAGLGEAKYTRALANARESGRWWQDLVDAALHADVPLAWRSLGLIVGRQGDAAAQAFAQHALLQAARQGDPVSAALAADRARRGLERTSATLPDIEVDAVTRRPAGLGDAEWQFAEGVLGQDETLAIRLAAAGLFAPSRALDPSSGMGLQLRIRTSEDATIDPLMEDLAMSLVRARLCALADVDPRQSEPMVVLRYRPGQEYRLHRDVLPPSVLADPEQGRGGQRVATVIAYLNDVPAGGETHFPLRDLRITPRHGAALAFRNLGKDGTVVEESLHAGLPVVAGEKWIATCWLRQTPLRLI